MEQRRGETSARPPWGWGLVAGLVFTAAVLLPEIPEMNTHFLGLATIDSMGTVAIHDVYHRYLLQGRLPVHVPELLYPVGAPFMASQGTAPIEFLPTLPLRVFPLPLRHNLALVICLPLNVLAFLPLGMELWRNRAAALAGGLCFAFAPIHLGEIRGGHTTVIVLMGLPIAVLGFLRIAEGTGKRAWLLAAIGWALTGLGYWYHGIFLGMLLPIFAAFGLRRRRWVDLVREYGLAGVTALALVLPFLLPAVWPVYGDDWYPFMSDELAPGPPLQSSFGPGVEGAAAHGLAWCLVLATLPTLWRGQRRGLWLALAVVTVAFALPPLVLASGLEWRLPGWFYWRYGPMGHRFHHPYRWLVLTSVFLAVLGVEGIARWRPRLALLLPIVLLAEGWVGPNLPMGSWRLRGEEVFRRLADGGDGAVIYVPFAIDSEEGIAHVFHGRPSLAGMFGGVPQSWPPEWIDFVNQSPLLLRISEWGQGIDRPVATTEEDLARLREAGFTTVLVARPTLDRAQPLRFERMRDLLEACFGRPVVSGPDAAAFRLPVLPCHGAEDDLPTTTLQHLTPQAGGWAVIDGTAEPGPH